MLFLFYPKAREISQKHVKNHKKVVCPRMACELGQSPGIFRSHLHSSLGFKPGYYIQISEQTIETADFSGAVCLIFAARTVPFYTIRGLFMARVK